MSPTRIATEAPSLPAMRIPVPANRLDAPQAEVTSDSGAVVRKTYLTPALQRWRSFRQPSPAEREFANLDRARRVGVPCVEPVRWRAERSSLGCVPICYLDARFADGARSAIDFLTGCSATVADRHAVLRKIGAVVRCMHQAGIHWGRAHARSILVSPERGVELCDFSAAVSYSGSIVDSSVGNADLHDLLFSWGYRFHVADKLRVLRGYWGGSAAARGSLARLSRRSRVRNSFLRILASSGRRALRCGKAMLKPRVEVGPWA